MRAMIVVFGTAALAACGASDARYTFDGTVTACERREWAETRVDLLEDDPAEAGRFASTRCFNVEGSAEVVIAEQPFGGALRGSGSLVRITVVGDLPLEHYASAELRRTLGLEVRRTGWVRRGDLLETP